MVSSPAFSDVFWLDPANSPNYADTGWITWISPVTGTITISGNAWTTNQRSNVTVEYVPAYIATTVNNPGDEMAVLSKRAQEKWREALYSMESLGTTDKSETSPADFGTSASIPCQNGGYVYSQCGAYQAPVPPITVKAGDMLAAVIENDYQYAGDTVGLDLNIQINGDAQGSGGTSADPQALASIAGGLDGTLDPSSGHSSDWYSFYWGGGDFGGNAATQATFVGNTSVAAGFASGMQLNLFSSAG